MNDPKLYRFLRHPDQKKRAQALTELVEGDYMETMESICQGIRVLAPGKTTKGIVELVDGVIELQDGCEAQKSLHKDIYKVAIRWALFKTGRLIQDPNHKGIYQGFSTAERRETQWSTFKRGGASRVVALGGLPGLRHFGPLNEKVKTSKFIWIHCMPDLATLDFGEILPELEEIWISDCAGLASLDGLSSMRSLKRAWIRGLPLLSDIDILKEIPQLEEIRLCDCPALSSIEDLSGLSNLKTVYIEYCKSLEVIPSTWPNSLARLTLKQIGINSIGHLPQSLKEVIDLRGCENLKTLDGIESCTGLAKIIVSPSIEDCSALENLENAWLHFDFKGSTSRELPEKLINSLAELSGLRLEISDSHRPLILGNPEAISILSKLKAIDLSSCEVSDPSIFIPLSQLELLKVQPRSPISKNLGGCTFNNKGEIDAMRLRLLAM